MCEPAPISVATDRCSAAWPLAVVMAHSRPLERALYPIALAVKVTPVVLALRSTAVIDPGLSTSMLGVILPELKNVFSEPEKAAGGRLPAFANSTNCRRTSQTASSHHRLQNRNSSFHLAEF